MIQTVSILINGEWRDFSLGETMASAGLIKAIEIKEYVILECENGDIYYTNMPFIAKTFKP
jgi:hypothetical protein